MYTNYRHKTQNKKAIYLLVALSVLGFVCFKFTKINTVKGNNENPESCTPVVVSSNNQDSLTILDLSSDGTVTDISPQKVTTSTPGVLGSSSGGGCTTTNLYESSKTCGKSDNGFSADGKNFVASEVEIEMSQINAPFVILAGADKTKFKDSNREFTKESPVYKAGGEQFTLNHVLVYAAPGEESETLKTKFTTGVPVKKNFGTKYTVAADESDNSADGEVVVNKYIPSDCVECNNLSNPTPTKSNEMSKVLKAKVSYPNQDKEEAAQESQASTITINNSCEDKQDEDMQKITTPACVNNWNAMAGALASLFPTSNWGSCNPEKDKNCISSGNLTVKMSPMFKETNSYMEARNKELVDPKSSYGATYIMTPCKAVIKSRSTGNVMAEVSVRCAWDLSYLFYERDAAENDDAPGSKDTISKAAYLLYLEKESLSRAGSLTSL